MSLERIKSIVGKHPEWFPAASGNAKEVMKQPEDLLSFSFPPPVKWLMEQVDTSKVGAMPNLEESVDETCRLRSVHGWPEKWILIDDRGDAGAVLMDMSTNHGTVYWVSSHAIAALVFEDIIQDADQYREFSDWLAYCLEDTIEEAQYQ